MADAWFVGVSVVVGGLVLALAYVLLFRKRSSNAAADAVAGAGAVPWPSHLPGMAPSHPDSGNLEDIKAAGDFFQFLTQLHARYGAVASFWYGQQHLVSVSSAEAFKATAHLFDRPTYLYEAVVPMITPHSIQVSNGPVARQRRAAYFDPTFTMPAIRTMEPALRRTVRLFLAACKAAAASNTLLSIRDEALDLSLRGIGCGAFGDALFRDERMVQRVRTAYLESWRQLEARIGAAPPADTVNPMADGRPPATLQAFEASVKALQQCVRELVDAARPSAAAAPAAAVPDDVKGSTKAAANANAPSAVDDAEADGMSLAYASTNTRSFAELMLRDPVGATAETSMADAITMLIAGFHTTGNLMVWLCIYVCQNPHVLQGIRAEIDAVRSEHDGDAKTADAKAADAKAADAKEADAKAADEKAAADGDAKAADAWWIPPVDVASAEMPYLRAVIDETLRCCELGPFASRFHPTEPVAIPVPTAATAGAGGGADSKSSAAAPQQPQPSTHYVLPPNTGIVQALGVSQHDAAYWPDPERFDPQRFLDAAQRKSRPALAFAPFGFAGKRRCPGVPYAYVTAAMAAAALFGAFDVAIAPPHAGANAQPIEKWHGLVTTPKTDVKLTFKPRTAASAKASA